MYFLIPGILSQTIVAEEVYQLDLPPAIAAFLSESATGEVQGLIEGKGQLPEIKSGAEVSSVVTAYNLQLIASAQREAYSTPKAFSGLEQVERGEAEIFSTLTATSLWTIETGIRVRSPKPTTDLLSFEIGGIEVNSTITSQELLITNSASRQPVTIGNAIDFSGVIGSQFLPGSPGYVAGEATPAVELIGVEVGYPPQPLPTGFYGEAESVYGVEAANAEVKSTLPGSDLPMVESYLAEPKTTLPASLLDTLEVGNEVYGKVLEASTISTVESVAKESVVAPSFSELGLIEVGTTEVGSPFFAVEYLRIETGDRYLNA